MRARRRVVQEGGLGDLAEAFRAYTRAEAKLRREILFAHEAGSSLRAIAETVSMSPETVRAMIAKARDERDSDLGKIDRLDGFGLSVSAKSRAEAERAALKKKWNLSVRELDR